MRRHLRTPRGFSFRRTVFSHGWFALPPFRADLAGERLETVLEMPGGGARALSLAPDGARIVLESRGSATPAEAAYLEARACRMLGLDLDLDVFHEHVRGDPATAWIADAGAGRLLRGATAFEDAVKLVLTTNCTWGATTRMVRALVERHGVEAADGRRAFPGPERLRGMSAVAWRDGVRAGYRAPLLVELVRQVRSGIVQPERWHERLADIDALRRELLALPGVGPYVADNLLRMLGRPAGLGLDSWLRGKYAEVYHGGRRVTDRTITRRYARHGRWAGLVLWCEMTRDWFDGDRPSARLAAWAEEPGG